MFKYYILCCILFLNFIFCGYLYLNNYTGSEISFYTSLVSLISCICFTIAAKKIHNMRYRRRT